MKKVIMLLCLLFSFVDNNASAQSVEQDKFIDSILTNKIAFLEAALSNEDKIIMTEDNSDSLMNIAKRQIEIVRLFESLTNIPALVIDQYAYSKDYDYALLSKWEKWFNSNRKLIFWDKNDKTLKRRDLNVTTDELKNTKNDK